MKVAAVIVGAWIVGAVVVCMLFHQMRKRAEPEPQSWLDEM